MDARLIDRFVPAVKNVFQTMASTKARVGEPHVEADGLCSADVSGAGATGLSGDANGSAVLGFPKAVACRAASGFADVEIGVDHPEFADAIGEPASMVASNAKSDLCDLWRGISLPRIVVGREHVVSHSRMASRQVVPCRTVLGDFFMDVALRVEKAVAALRGAAT